MFIIPIFDWLKLLATHVIYKINVTKISFTHNYRFYLSQWGGPLGAWILGDLEAPFYHLVRSTGFGRSGHRSVFCNVMGVPRCTSEGSSLCSLGRSYTFAGLLRSSPVCADLSFTGLSRLTTTIITSPASIASVL